MELANGPSAVGASLIVGCAVATVAALYILLGFAGKRFFARLDRQDDALATVLTNQEATRAMLGALEPRVHKLEKGHRGTRKILDRLTWVLENSEPHPVAEQSVTRRVSNEVTAAIRTPAKRGRP